MRAPKPYSIAACSLLLVAGHLAASPARWQDDKGAAIAQLLSAYHDSGRFDGALLVAESGRVVYRGGFGYANREWLVGADSDTKFAVGSVGKLFTAVLTLRLVEDGRLSLDDPISRHLPDHTPQTGVVTVHQLLSHTSGLPDYYDRTFVDEHMFIPYGRAAFFEKFCNVAPSAVPGSKGNYSSTNYCVLGAIIEAAGGKAFEEQLRAEVLDPIGATNSGLNLHSRIISAKASGYLRSLTGYRIADPEYPDVHAYGPGGMYSTVDDLFRLDRALHEKSLFATDIQDALHQPHAEGGFRAGHRFGYGSTVATAPLGPSGGDRTVHHAGGNTAGFTSSMTRVLEDQHVVILLTNAGPGWFDETVHEITNQILNILYGRPYELPLQPVERELYALLAEGRQAHLLERFETLKSDASFETTQRGLYSLGSELIREQRTEEAIAVFELVVAEFPESSWSYNGLGEAYLSAGEFARAKEFLERALSINPNNEQAASNLERLGALGD